MADVEPGALPSVAEARLLQRERQAERASAQLEEGPQQQRAQSPQERTAESQFRAATMENTSPRLDNASGFADNRRWEATQRETVGRQARRVRENDGGLRVIDGVTGIVSSLGDFMLGVLSGSSLPAPTKSHDMTAFVTDPQARKEQQLARLEETKARRTSDKAIDRMLLDLAKGQALRAEDIRSLTREHQEQIRNFGDSAVNQLVDEARKRAKDEERERER